MHFIFLIKNKKKITCKSYYNFEISKYGNVKFKREKIKNLNRSALSSGATYFWLNMCY